MPEITGYAWGSTEFFNHLESYYTEPPEEYEDFDPIEQAELQAEQDEARLWGL